MKSTRIAILSVMAAVSSVTALAAGSFQQIMPDNDLWKEDSLFSSPNVTEELFNQVIDAALEVYEPIAKAERGSVVVNRNWDDSTVNANCRRGFFGRVTINMYGGLARRQEISADAFALVLCHELGHAFAKEPYIQRMTRMSAEGQADYYGADTCLEQVLPKLPVPSPELLGNDNGTIREKCDKVAAVGTDANLFCVRRLSAGFGLGRLLASGEDTVPQYNTPDPKVVDTTMLSYPETTQCRLDTYFAGTFKMPRPACWFKN